MKYPSRHLPISLSPYLPISLSPYLPISLLLISLTLCACHKTCVCSGYDQIEHMYTVEEVDAHGGSCVNMRNYPVTNHYSVCSWE